MEQTHARITIFFLLSGILFIAIGSLIPLPEIAAKLLFDHGHGSLFPYPFTVQNLMWCIFFVGIGELYHRIDFIKQHDVTLQSGYLPEEQDLVLTQQDMGEIYRIVRRHSDGLAQLIKNLVLRFQAGRSVEQTHEMLNSQLDIRQYQLDNDYNMIRYISWLIPTLGFIGTVVGIAQTLAYAGSRDVDPSAPYFLADITMRLGVAFDTTLLALIMSALLVFGMHVIHGREEKIIIQSGQYCLDNLITRLYVDSDH